MGVSTINPMIGDVGGQTWSPIDRAPKGFFFYMQKDMIQKPYAQRHSSMHKVVLLCKKGATL